MCAQPLDDVVGLVGEVVVDPHDPPARLAPRDARGRRRASTSPTRPAAGRRTRWTRSPPGACTRKPRGRPIGSASSLRVGLLRPGGQPLDLHPARLVQPAQAVGDRRVPRQQARRRPAPPPLGQVEERGVQDAVDVQQQDRRGSGHDVVLPAQRRSGITPSRASVGTSTGTVSGYSRPAPVFSTTTSSPPSSPTRATARPRRSRPPPRAHPGALVAGELPLRGEQRVVGHRDRGAAGRPHRVENQSRPERAGTVMPKATVWASGGAVPRAPPRRRRRSARTRRPARRPAAGAGRDRAQRAARAPSRCR